MADQLPTPAVDTAQQATSTAAVPAPAPTQTPIAPDAVQAATTPPQNPAPAQPLASGFGVNFYREQRKKLEQFTERDKKIARYTMFGLVVFIIILIAVMAVNYLLTLEQSKIADETTKATQQLTSLSSLEKEYVVYASKIKLLAALDQERRIKRTATSYFYALVPPINVMREVSTDDEKNKSTIAFSIESPDVFALLDLLKIFGEKGVYDRGYLIGVTALSRSADGTYVISGAMNYARATDIAQLGASQ